MPVLAAAARRRVEEGGGSAVITRQARALARFVQVGRCALSGKRGAEGGRQAGKRLPVAGCEVRCESSNAPLYAV